MAPGSLSWCTRCSRSTRLRELASFRDVRRWLLAMTLAVFALFPVGLAISASPGHGKGCKKRRDGTFHGYCVHHKTVTRTHTQLVHVTHSTTNTITKVVLTRPTSTVGGTTTTTTSTAPATTTTTTTTPVTTETGTGTARVATTTTYTSTTTQSTGTVTSTKTVYTTTTGP